MRDDPRFDVQRQSTLTPEGQIESMGHFARGLGTERFRKILVIAMIALAAIAVIGSI